MIFNMHTKTSKYNILRRNIIRIEAVIIILLVPLLFLLLTKAPQNVSAGWWNDSWLYRKKILITNTAGTQSNYTYGFSLGALTSGQINSDCSDIRVNDTNSNPIIDPFWVDCTVPNSPTVWIKFSSLANDSTILYVYYGNSDASSIMANPESFFTYMHDFAGTSIDTSKITVDGGTTTQDEYLWLLNNSDAWDSYVYATSTQARAADLAFQAKFKATSGARSVIGWHDSGSGSNRSDLVYAIFLDAGTFDIYEDGNNRVGSGSYTVGTWYDIKVVLKATGAYYYYKAVDSNTWTSIYNSNYSSETPLKPGAVHYDSGEYSYTDNWIIRQQLSTEPTVSLDSEEKSPNPVAYWNFDEGYGDTTHNSGSGGSSLNGNLAESNSCPGNSACPTWKDGADCRFDKCLSFDGTNDFVAVGDSSVIDFTASDSFSISAWFKNPESPSGADTILSKYYSTTGTDGGYKLIMEVDGDITFAVDDDSTWGPDDSVTSTAASYDDNKWHHVVAVKTGTSSLTLYIDGIPVGTDYAISAASTLANTDSLYMGIDGDGAGSPWLGSLDEIKIYPFARTADQVKVDFNNAGEIFGSSTEYILNNDLAAYWKMDESTSNTCDATNDACDFSRNNNHAEWYDNATSGNGKFGNAIDLDGTNDRVATNSAIRVPIHYTWASELSSWTQRRLITINNSNISNLTNYQLELSILYDSDMQSDFDDIRFTDNAGANLDYWLESKTDSVSANVWVEINSIPAYSSSTIIMYYGNSGVSSQSNSSNTFEFFDGFDSDPGYTKVGGGDGSYTVSGSVITLTENTSSAFGMDHGYQITGSFAVTSGSYQVQASFQPSVLKEIHGIYFCGNIYGYNSASYFYQMAGTQSWGLTPEQAYSGSGLQTVYANLNDFSCTGNIAIMHDDDSTKIAESKYDYVFIRKYAASEPVSSIGLEQTHATTIPISVSAWVQADTLDSNQRMIIARGSSPSFDWFLGASATNSGKLVYSLDGGTNTGTSNTTLTTNSWYLVTVTSDGVATKLFVNGYLDSQTSNSGFLTGNGNISIGAGYNGTQGFDGKIDETRIYNRALTSAEVQQLYNWAPGPVGYWDLNENTGTVAYDKSGNGFTGTIQNIESNDWVTGKYGGALDLEYDNNSGEYITVEHNTSLNPKTITYSAWFKLKSMPANWSKVIIQKSNSSSNYTYDMMVISNVAGDAYEVYCEVSNNGSTKYNNSAHTINLNTWYYSTCTYDGETLNHYVDGVFIDENTSPSGNIYSNTQPLYISAFEINPDNSTDAVIDEVKIYNYPRTPAQIIEDMNAGHPAPGSPVGSAVGDWNFDEGYGDTANNSGSGGTSINGDLGAVNQSCPASGTVPCPGWVNDGKFGKALSFDGTDDYLSIGPVDSLKISNAITLSAWVNFDTIPTGLTETTIMSNNNSGGWGLLPNQVESGKIETYFYINSAYQKAGFNLSEISAGTWYHIVGTFDGTDSKIYLNGALKDTVTAAGTISNPSNVKPLIGANPGTGDNVDGDYFDGKIDEVQIFSSALTADQIKQLYNQGQSAVFGAVSTASSSAEMFSSARSYCPPGDTDTCNPPIAEWKFDENTGQSTYDTSGNEKNGTLTVNNSGRMPTWSHGKFGSSIDLGATSFSDYSEVDLGTDTLNNMINGASVVTVNGWIKPRSWIQWGNGIFNSFINSNSDNGIQIEIDDGESYKLRVSAESQSSDSAQTALSSSAIPLNQWTNFSTVIDYTNDIVYIYINGKLETSQAVSFGQTTYTKGIASAQDGFPGYYNFGYNGLVDEVRIYNYARTPAQIAWDYNLGEPVAHYRFDECSGTTLNNTAPKADPRGISGYNGTITPNTGRSVGSCSSGVSTEMWNGGTTGKYSASLDFDGAGDYVDIGDQSALDFTDSFSISAWIKTDASGGTYKAIAGKCFLTGGCNGYGLYLNSDDSNHIYFQVRNDSTTSQADGGSVNNNTWHHLVGIRDHSTNTTKIYVDGSLINSDTTILSSGYSNSVKFGLGARDNGSWLYYYDGQIDEVKIFNYALTPEQVKTDYSNGAVRF